MSNQDFAFFWWCFSRDVLHTHRCASYQTPKLFGSMVQDDLELLVENKCVQLKIVPCLSLFMSFAYKGFRFPSEQVPDEITLLHAFSESYSQRMSRLIQHSDEFDGNTGLLDVEDSVEAKTASLFGYTGSDSPEREFDGVYHIRCSILSL